MIRPRTMIALQETHGAAEELRHHIYLAHKKSAAFASAPRHDAGGVAILLHGLSQCEANKAMGEGRIRHSVSVPGYLQRLQVMARPQVRMAHAGRILR
eukprot:6217394-Pyramimonas_sp.AAC.1